MRCCPNFPSAAAAVLLVLAMLWGTDAASAEPDQRIYQAAKENRQSALDFLKQIVDIDSGTGDVAGGNKVAAILASRLRALGAQIQRQAAEAQGLPDNLIATFHGSGKGKILIIAHLDTVFGPGTVAVRPFRCDANRAYGPGVADEKAGLVDAITALKILHDTGFTNYSGITLLVDTSEETGSRGSTKLIQSLAAQNDVELNMEPADPSDSLTVWRKGSAAVTIAVKGRAAHAGVAPQDGRNAAIELIHQINALDGVFPSFGDGLTVNLTMMKAGERHNIIPDYAEAGLNVRYRAPEQLEQVFSRIKLDAQTTKIPDTIVTVTSASNYPPLIENAQIDSLAGRARAIYAEIGKTLVLSGSGGASESALAMKVGTPALDGLGFVGAEFHTDKEWMDLASVTPRLYLMTRLLMELGSAPLSKTKGQTHDG